MRFYRSAFALGLFVTLALVASASHGAGRICTSADTLAFGQRLVGTSTGATVVVSNCGTETWSFTDVSINTATNAAYRIESTCVTGMALGPSASCAIDVHFEPTAPGQTSGAVWLHNTTPNPDQLITFYGRAIDAQAGTAALRFSPPIVNFGSEVIGTETPAIVVTLANVGTATLVPSALVLNGVTPYDFRGASGPKDCGIGRGIAPGASCTLSLFFAPRDVGSRQATLVVDAPQLESLAFLTLTGQGTAATLPIDVIEFHNAEDGQYFLTGDAREIALLDAGRIGAGWSRTGMSFHAFANDAAGADALPVCRFFGTPGVGPNSHFYTAYDNECEIVRKNTNWIEEGVTFHARLPVDGSCSLNDVTVVRLFWPGESVTASRHRYVVEPSIAGDMKAAGWLLEGPVFCAPR
jgi:hypothetical protein